MSADDTMAPIHQRTLDFQPWTHVCGCRLQMTLRYNGVSEFPLWRTLDDNGVIKCPQCGAWLRSSDQGVTNL